MSEKKDPNAERVNIMYSPTKLDYTFTASDFTTAYLQKLAQGKFIGDRVAEGESVYSPPRGVCPETGRATTEYVDLPNTGKVKSFTIVHIPIPENPMKPPLTIANIQLDGADNAFLHLIGECKNEDVYIGMPVEAIWQPKEQWTPSPTNIQYFAPTDSSVRTSPDAQNEGGQ